MANKRLINYILKNLEKGYSLANIRKRLVTSHYEDDVIDEAFEHIQKTKKIKKYFGHHKSTLIIQVLVIIGLIAFFTFMLLSKKIVYTVEVLEGDYYIYPENNNIVISRLDGSDKKILFDNLPSDAGYISPKGNYFIKIKDDKLLEVQNLKFETIMDLSLRHKRRPTDIFPSKCKWGSEERFLVCEYFYEDVNFDDKKTFTLMIFDVLEKEHSIIRTVRVEDFTRVKTSYDFSGSELYYGGIAGISQISNVKNFLKGNENVKFLKNIKGCENINLFSEKIFCSLSGELLDLDSKYYILMQNLNQTATNKYTVVNEEGLNEIFEINVIDESLLLVKSDNTFFLDLLNTEIIASSNVFGFERSKRRMPVVFTENKVKKAI